MLGYDMTDIDIESVKKYLNDKIHTDANLINIERMVKEFNILRQKIMKTYAKFLQNQHEYISDNKDLREIILNYYIENFVNKKNSGIFISLFTDFYTLMRLLKKFDNKERGPKLCANHNELDKIIMYAGGFHINVVRDILVIL